MPVTKPNPLDKTLAKTRTELASVGSPALSEAKSLVVTTEREYLIADGLRARIKGAIRVVEQKVDPIIEDIRPGLDKLYALKREMIRPLEEADGVINNKMKVFRIAEQRRIQDEESAKRQEAVRIEREAEEKRRKAAQAATPQVAKRLETQATKLEEKAQDVVTTPVRAAVEAEHSTTRTVRKWKLGDLGTLLQGILDGDVPVEAVILNEVFINSTFRRNPAEVEAWPGLTLFDDVQIVTRRGI